MWKHEHKGKPHCPSTDWYFTNISSCEKRQFPTDYQSLFTIFQPSTLYQSRNSNACINLCGQFCPIHSHASEWLSLTHWGQVTHICVGNLIIIGSDNGLSPGRCKAIIWNNAGILSIGPLGTNFSEILIEIYTFSFKKMHLKMLCGKWWPFRLSLFVFTAFLAVEVHVIPSQEMPMAHP